jgi:putative ATPase
MAGDLFSAAVEEQLRSRAPLAARMRPRSLDDVVGQEHLLATGAALRVLIESDRLGSTILWGPPGVGKTTIAELVAVSTQRHFERLSAVTAGVKDVRSAVDAAHDRLGAHGRGTIIFVDEIHRFSTAQQDALLPAVETGVVALIGATTENPYFTVNSPLRSRSTLFRLEPLDDAAIADLVQRAAGIESVQVAADACGVLVRRAAGDARAAITALEVSAALARHGAPHAAVPNIDLRHVEAALSASAARYGRDDHYDVTSAFIKSIRGSDADAATYWLARMLEAGEDPRFIARRLVIAASEDIGVADSMALVVAVAAAHAVEFVGLPEAQLNLSHAVRYLAGAPKNDAAARAIWGARETVRRDGPGEVPPHLRDAHYAGADALGHGVGYVSPHDDPQQAARQQYLPRR